MGLTRAADERRWLFDLAALAGAVADDDPAASLVPELGARLRSEFSCFAERAAEPPETVASEFRLEPGAAQQLVAMVRTHPLWRPVVDASVRTPAPPVRISDVISASRWREHPINREVLRPLGLAGHTVSIAVSTGSSGDVAWYAFNRDRDFHEREMALLARLQPLLTVLHDKSRRRRPPAALTLTERELQVVGLLARGLTAAATARRLGIAKRTVDKHLEHVHAKLDTSGPVATVNEARRRGLLGDVARGSPSDPTSG